MCVPGLWDERSCRNVSSRFLLLVVAVLLGLAGSLLSAGPASALSSVDGGKPSVQKTRSADVKKVGRSSLKVDDQTGESAKKPPPDFPADGEAAIVPVDGSWSAPTDFGVSVRSDDPNTAPTNVAVEVVGQQSEDGVGGGGLVLEVTPTKDTATASGEAAGGVASSPAPEDQPTASPDSSSSEEPAESVEKAAPSPEPEPTADPAAPGSVKPETGFTGAVEVRIDYAKFASAGGGDWASRLKLVRVEDCRAAKGKGNEKKVDCVEAAPLETTDGEAAPLESTDGEAAPLESTDGETASLAAEDESASLESTNDSEEQTVSMVVPAETLDTGSPTMFALAATNSGSTGTYAATPLNPAGRGPLVATVVTLRGVFRSRRRRG